MFKVLTRNTLQFSKKLFLFYLIFSQLYLYSSVASINVEQNEDLPDEECTLTISEIQKLEISLNNKGSQKSELVKTESINNEKNPYLIIVNKYNSTDKLHYIFKHETPGFNSKELIRKTNPRSPPSLS